MCVPHAPPGGEGRVTLLRARDGYWQLHLEELTLKNERGMCWNVKSQWCIRQHYWWQKTGKKPNDHVNTIHPKNGYYYIYAIKTIVQENVLTLSRLRIIKPHFASVLVKCVVENIFHTSAWSFKRNSGRKQSLLLRIMHWTLHWRAEEYLQTSYATGLKNREPHPGVCVCDELYTGLISICTSSVSEISFTLVYLPMRGQAKKALESSLVNMGFHPIVTTMAQISSLKAWKLVQLLWWEILFTYVFVPDNYSCYKLFVIQCWMSVTAPKWLVVIHLWPTGALHFVWNLNVWRHCFWKNS